MIPIETFPKDTQQKVLFCPLENNRLSDRNKLLYFLIMLNITKWPSLTILGKCTTKSHHHHPSPLLIIKRCVCGTLLIIIFNLFTNSDSNIAFVFTILLRDRDKVDNRCYFRQVRRWIRWWEEMYFLSERVLICISYKAPTHPPNHPYCLSASTPFSFLPPPQPLNNYREYA